MSLSSLPCGAVSRFLLVFLGAYFGYKAETITFPTVTSTIARAIPTPPPVLNPKLHMITTGIVPFAAAYVELFFIMTSMWMDQFYYVFGFTLIVFVVLLDYMRRSDSLVGLLPIVCRKSSVVVVFLHYVVDRLPFTRLCIASFGSEVWRHRVCS